MLGIIPARGGSKGIPRKNLAILEDRPLIAWTIDTAQRAGILDRLIVSTDDEQIAEISSEWGAEIPFMRPAELAQDDTQDIDVCVHVLKHLAEEGYEPDLIVWLRPTSPFRSVEDIESAVNIFKDSKPDSVRSICLVEHHPYWTYRFEDGWITPFIEGVDVMGKYSRRQLLPPVFRLNGAVEVLSREMIIKRGLLYGDRIRGYVMPQDRSIEIDTVLDLDLARTILRGSKHD